MNGNDMAKTVLDYGLLQFVEGGNVIQQRSGSVSPFMINYGRSGHPVAIKEVIRWCADEWCQQPFECEVIYGPPPNKSFVWSLVVTLYDRNPLFFTYGAASCRKEAEVYGERRVDSGAPMKGKRVVIFHDVLAKGSTVRQAVLDVYAEGGTVVGVFVMFDRMERSSDGRTERALLSDHLGVPVYAVSTIQDLINEMSERKHPMLAVVQEYQKEHCVM